MCAKLQINFREGKFILYFLTFHEAENVQDGVMKSVDAKALHAVGTIQERG